MISPRESVVESASPFAEQAPQPDGMVPVFAPCLTAASVAEATRGKGMASDPDKDWYFN
ncbi:hypothetical protein GCM10010329_82800 [Streptomyces spiroverticillatus]|uniref:Uncharacterized protein n=1 Tax=Streptomyces finlayi TaxID=67296 RepID=A0A918X9Y2_9ACTN|nr:hypothetical protein [Streptomyces finlayi]GHA47814.1 hypothetical protein GCM10010329_82800 [Streptomyces spiroverticillatus]GHD18758.1 hypothetical protein GCM10010334_81870 [Streptomyces finlayi]